MLDNAGEEERYLKSLLGNVRNGLLALKDDLLEDGKPLVKFPRIWMLALSLMYVDERVRHEGYDIELMAARQLPPMPELPGGAMLTSVEPVAGGFIMRGMLGEWQRSLSREGVERLLAGMRAGNDRIDL